MFSFFYLAYWLEAHKATFETYPFDELVYLKLTYTSDVDDSRRAVIGTGLIDSIEAAFQLDQVLMELRTPESIETPHNSVNDAPPLAELGIAV